MLHTHACTCEQPVRCVVHVWSPCGAAGPRSLHPKLGASLAAFPQLNGTRIYKPFVEKPVSGEDHNIWVYYPHSHVRATRRSAPYRCGLQASACSDEASDGPVQARASRLDRNPTTQPAAHLLQWPQQPRPRLRAHLLVRDGLPALTLACCAAQGGGVKYLFRKVDDKASKYDSNHDGRVRRDGSYIYEEFLPTGGTDVRPA
jgi:hypothetical protein